MGLNRTMAFSKAARVMMSRGLMFFSRRLRMAAPTVSHSCIFSGYSAGKLDEPGRVMPIASAALAMVLLRGQLSAGTFRAVTAAWFKNTHAVYMPVRKRQ